MAYLIKRFCGISGEADGDDDDWEDGDDVLCMRFIICFLPVVRRGEPLTLSSFHNKCTIKTAKDILYVHVRYMHYITSMKMVWRR